MSVSALQRIAAGDRSAVAECLDTYGGLVWSLARKFAPNPADAEDAVQEIFIDLWSNASRFDPAVAPEVSFVAMIARRRLIDRWRRRKRQPSEEPLEPTVASDAPGVETDYAVKDQVERVGAVIQTMKPEQQQVLRMAVYEGFTHREIADKLSMPLGTVKTHARRGLIRIREQLGADGGGDEVGS